MQVEEDPSSQFVDFTNATASEQFVSDVEQALIGWQLAGKGHASLAALGASSASQLGARKPEDAAIWTKELQFLAPIGQKDAKTYTLTLFVAAHADPRLKPPAETQNKAPKATRWQEGLEHFTPTMLAVADASRDFHWGVGGEQSKENEEPEDVEQDTADRRSSYYTSVFEDDGEPAFSRRTAFKNVQKWFGVDEFLLLGRSSPHERKKQERSDRSREDAEDAEDAEEKLGEGGSIEQEVSVEQEVEGGKENAGENGGEDAMADIHVDQNEAGMLLSALTMALNNCNCTIPAFVPVFEPSRGTWIGSAVPGATGNVSMSFDTDSVPELNPNQSCISGLLDFFKVKLQLPPHIEEKCRVEADESGGLAIEGDGSGENGELDGRSGLPLVSVPSSVEHGAPLGELVAILATRMSQLHGINSMSLLWVEFVKALRERWFQQQLLPYMGTSTKENGVDHNTSSHSLDALFLLDSEAMQLPPPDFRHCLLHQKLQLLNSCILREAQESRPASNSGDRIKANYNAQQPAVMKGDARYPCVIASSCTEAL
ncbi:Rab3 GTPase-activating protein catalytic subunit [Phytophthora cinnamomi]|uniref:Rab3 GTPase-activating protein catalytic subunit n=1 Tax=Phytophthora cinnamomi TaxID=4785 RepID=UPI00355A50CB|nr:Rab3 GTPase-activating protein catalytic subunit [Phytophthora cinnamomi]